MKTNQGAIVPGHAADQRVRAVLREWGYKEGEIQRLLKQPTVDYKLETRHHTTHDQAGKTTRNVS